MIKLKNLISESKKLKLNFRNVLPGGIDASVDVEFSAIIVDDRFVFLPKTSKDLDKIDTLKLYKEDVAVLIENRINSQFKEVEFKYDKSYQGAGYGFNIDLNKILNKLK